MTLQELYEFLDSEPKAHVWLILAYEAEQLRKWHEYRSEFIETDEFAWHPDNPCLTLVHKRWE